MRLHRIGAFVVLALVGCRRSESAGASPSASASSATGDEAVPARTDALARIAIAEHSRRAGGITNDDVTSRDVVVRRNAARAASRIGGEDGRDRLAHMLGDDDPTVVTFAAYGLGQACATGERDATVDALVARLSTIDRTSRFAANGGLEHPMVAIARAVGTCNTERSEEILAGFLGGGEIETAAAILGLGNVAVSKKRLREETIASLLNVAAGSAATRPEPMALFPLARVDNVPPSVTSRLAEVARTRLDESSPYRIFAVRALEKSKDAALPGLERVLTAPEFETPERVEAVRALKRLGKAGEEVLVKHLDAAFPSQSEVETGEPRYVVFAAMLDAITDGSKARAVLERATRLAVPEAAPPRRRVAHVACRAAVLLAGGDASAPVLVQCDPSNGAIGELAAISVIERGGRATKTRFEALLASKSARVRESALKLVVGRDDVDAVPTFAAALGAAETGVAIAALEELALHPELASTRKRAKPSKKPGAKNDKDEKKTEPPAPPDPKIIDALGAALERARTANDPELDAAAMQAVAALGVVALDAKIDEAFCKSAYPVDREKAKDALSILRKRKVECLPWATDDARWRQPSEALVVPEVLRPAKGAPRIVFDTDAGELSFTLDLDAAPAAGTRLVELVRSGYYDGNVIHRVDPAFVVQFGSPAADGSGGPPDRAPLRCETSPRPFERMSVGVALSGRDTGSSQFFVTLGRSPHLDGRYAWVGVAAGPWDHVVEGDTIVKARVVD